MNAVYNTVTIDRQFPDLKDLFNESDCSTANAVLRTVEPAERTSLI
jgi:hypothetical protein